MHLQNFFFFVILAITPKQAYTGWVDSTSIITASTSTITASTSTAAATTTTLGWNWNKNYRVEDSEENYKKKPSYNDRDRYNDNYPSYGDKNNDDDDYNRDYKPSKSRSSKRKRYSPDDMGHMNVYIREPSRDGKRKKPRRFRFSVARYERSRFPTFGPLINFLPWLPIFVDRLTKQTFIYSVTHGVYILPPLINFYGKLISVAELIVSGYASLVSTGAPPPPAIDIAPLVQPGPVVGPGAPVIDPKTGGFKGGVRTEYGSFILPKYPKILEDEEESSFSQQDQGRYSGKNNYRSQSRPNYGDQTISDGGY
jgi:hypothetical protein